MSETKKVVEKPVEYVNESQDTIRFAIAGGSPGEVAEEFEVGPGESCMIPAAYAKPRIYHGQEGEKADPARAKLPSIIEGIAPQLKQAKAKPPAPPKAPLAAPAKSGKALE